MNCLGDMLHKVHGRDLVQSGMILETLASLICGPAGSTVELQFLDQPKRTAIGQYMVWLVREPEWSPVNSVPVPVSPHALPPLPPFPPPPPPSQTLHVQRWLNAESSRIMEQTVSRDHGVLSPFIGVMQAPVMSLMEAAVAAQVPHIDASA